MPIPSILALDINYQMSDENYQKTVCLKLDIDKEKFENMNNIRVQEGKEEITLEQVNALVVKGSVEKKEDGFFFKMNPSPDEVEISKIVNPLLNINISYFKKNQKVFLHLAPQFNDLTELKNFKEIINNYYLPIREQELKNQLKENFSEVIKEESKFYSVYHSLLKLPLQQVETALLPSLLGAQESKFIEETDGDFYKYVIYVPEDCFWELPRNMRDEIVKPSGIKFVLRYLNMDEIDETKSHLLESEDYVNKIGSVIFENNVDLNADNPFEIDLSTEDFRQNNSIVEKAVYPKFIKDDNGEIAVSRPERSRNFLLKAFFGVNGKHFDQKIKKLNGTAENL